jgi:hypothetical protein
MEDNLIAQAALFVWRILGDFWEIYQLPLDWLSQWFYVDGAASLSVYAAYIFFTIAALGGFYLWIYLPSRWRTRRTCEMQIAIDESFSTERQYSDGLDHKATEDYRLQYLNILRENNKKLDAIYEQLALIRIQQRDFNND